MALNDDITTFITKLVSWSNVHGKELATLDDAGLGSTIRAKEIVSQTLDVMELIDALYVTDIEIVDDDSNVKLNYLQDTEADIYQLMDDWNHYLKLDVLPVGYLPLEGQYYLITSQSGDVEVGDGLPSGGGPDYILGQDAVGNPIWILKPTIFELDETI